MSKKRPIPVLLSDSDAENIEEKPSSKAKKARKSDKKSNNASLDQFLSSKDSNKSNKPATIENFFKKDVAKKPKESSKVNVDDFFGSSSAESTIPKKSPIKAQLESRMSPKKLMDTSNGKSPIKSQLESKISPKKVNDSCESSSLMSKSPIVKKNLTNKSPKKDQADVKDSPEIDKKISPKKKSPMKTTETPEKKSKVFVPETPSKDDDSILNSSTNSVSEKKNKYFSYMSREGPQMLGQREIPQGSANCLNGLTFVFTGVMDYIERDDAQKLVVKCGGRVTQSISKKTTYLVTGRECGESKLAKAKSCNVKLMTEDEFFSLMESHSKKTKHNEVKLDEDSSISKPLTGFSLVKNRKSDTKQEQSPPKKIKKTEDEFKEPTKSPKKIKKDDSSKEVSSESQTKTLEKPLGSSSHDLWVDKYRPKARNNLIGHNGEKSPANKLFAWLSAWQNDFSKGLKEKAYNSAPPWGASASDDGKWSRAVLLSGPPGIGKTSAAMVICNELGYSYTEMNASDSRSKNMMKEQLGDSLKMSHLKDMAIGSTKTLNVKKHALIMDEIDGMAGNEDRGGIQEIISMIKTSKIPVICICNDRQSQKIRSLSNYCLDLRFSRPRVEQIRSTLMSICYKEGVKVPQSVLNEIIEASNHDIRQVINTVQMWSRENNFDVAIQAAPKDLKVGAFDVIRKIFQPEISGKGGKPVTMTEAMDHFFQDYSLVPLFVQESYLKISQRNSGGPHAQLEALAKASYDMCTGDMISHAIRKAGTGSWSLLPVEAIFSTVAPGFYVRGSLPGGPMGVSFPAWFGKNSTTSKSYRQLTQLSTHMRLSSEAGSYTNSSLSLDLLHYLSTLMTTRIAEGDIEFGVNTLNDYNLLKDDYDAINELTTWPNIQKSAIIDSKIKAAFTRAYNKSEHLLPYSTQQSTVASKKRGTASVTGEEDEFNEEDEDVEEKEDDLTAFKIKSTGKKAAAAAATSTTKEASKVKKRVVKK